MKMEGKNVQESQRESSVVSGERRLTVSPGKGISPIENESGEKSELAVSAATQAMVSRETSELLKTGVLDSMSYCDDAMSALLGRMKGMYANSPEPEVRTYDPDKVTTTALCARTIAELIKAKTDAMRLLK